MGKWGLGQARPPRDQGPESNINVGLRLRRPWPLIVFALIVESLLQTCISAPSLSLPSRRPLPVRPRAPGMPLVET